MFIDLTRYGGVRALRVAVAAIAYIDAVEFGAAVHLIGAETLRVNEDPAQIEERIDAAIALTPLAIGSMPNGQHPADALRSYQIEREASETKRRKGKPA